MRPQIAWKVVVIIAHLFCQKQQFVYDLVNMNAAALAAPMMRYYILDVQLKRQQKETTTKTKCLARFVFGWSSSESGGDGWHCKEI